jgi:hypothetical protein
MKLASLTLAWQSSTGTEILTSIFHVGRITLLLALPLLLRSTATTVWNSHVVMIWNPLHVTRGLRVLRDSLPKEQLFLRLLLTYSTCRASEYTLDLESCLGTLRQS